MLIIITGTGDGLFRSINIDDIEQNCRWPLLIRLSGKYSVPILFMINV